MYEALLNKLQIRPDAGDEAIRSRLEEKQMEYAERLNHATDPDRIAELKETLAEMEQALYSMKENAKQYSSGLLRDEAEPEKDMVRREAEDDFSDLKGSRSLPGEKPGPEQEKYHSAAKGDRAALQWLLDASNKGGFSGNAWASYYAGRLYEEGAGVPGNDEEAIGFYQLAGVQAKDNNHLHAMSFYKLGFMCENGRGTGQSYKGAATFYLQAVDADPEMTSAYYDAGRMYEKMQDFERAADYYRKAMACGDPATAGKAVKALDEYNKRKDGKV